MDEGTPLLGAVHPVTEPLPEIRQTVDHVQRLDPRNLGISELCPHALPTRSAQTAFALIVLLQWRLNRIRPIPRTRDTWEIWDKERDDASVVDTLDQSLASLWSAFLEEYRSPQEMEDVLWVEFLDKGDGSRTLRVVDFLSDVDAPSTLLSHRIVHLSLLRTWKRGFLVAGQYGNRRRLEYVARYDSFTTPRVLHFIELIFYMSYLVILVRFLLSPPPRPKSTNDFVHGDWHGHFLMAFAVASLARSWTISSLPFLVVFVAFSSCLPSHPVPGDISFNVLLVALALHTLQLHLPSGPGPILLFPFHACLPLCALLGSCLSRVIFPVLALFLPVMLLTWISLCLSLKDNFPLNAAFHLLPSPMQTRVGLLAMLGIEIALLIPALLTPLVLTGPFSQRNHSVRSWDRYSETIGLEARKYFVRAVIAYSTPHTFPPPLNLLPLFLQLPSSTLRMHCDPSSVPAVLERWLWRITVGPVGFVVSLLLFW